MSVHEHPQTQDVVRGSTAGRRAGHRSAAIAFGLCGAVAAFVGLFILLGGDDSYVQFGWADPVPATDIDPGWGFGLLAAGIVGLVIAAALAIRDRRTHAYGDAALPVEHRD